MSFGIRFSPEAEETYNSVVTQLRQRWGDGVVAKFEAKLLSALEKIAENPFLYAVINDNLQVRRCTLHKNVSVMYKVYENQALIVCFWDNRQQPLFF